MKKKYWKKITITLILPLSRILSQAFLHNLMFASVLLWFFLPSSLTPDNLSPFFYRTQFFELSPVLFFFSSQTSPWMMEESDIYEWWRESDIESYKMCVREKAVWLNCVYHIVMNIIYSMCHILIYNIKISHIVGILPHKQSHILVLLPLIFGILFL